MMVVVTFWPGGKAGGGAWYVSLELLRLTDAKCEGSVDAQKRSSPDAAKNGDHGQLRTTGESTGWQGRRSVGCVTRQNRPTNKKCTHQAVIGKLLAIQAIVDVDYDAKQRPEDWRL